MAPKICIAFDLYGTLLSTESIAKELASHFGDEKAGEVAALWRRFQLEYTWRLTSMSSYKPFSEVTQASLLHALSASGVGLKDPQIDSLMKAYDSLDTFSDVEPGLKIIASSDEIQAFVFSNGTHSMVSTSLHKSPSLSPYASVFTDVVTVEEVKSYKPDPKVYEYLLKRAGKAGESHSVWLVSGNPFDIVGARAAGMQAAWVTREGGKWIDRLGDCVGVEPTMIVSGVEEAVSTIKTRMEEQSA